MFSQTLHYILTNLQHYYPSLLAFIGSGAFISLITQITKQAKQWSKDTVIQRFVLGTAFIGSAGDWYIQNYSTHFAHAVTPYVWFPAVTAALFTLATFLHKWPIKQIVAFVKTNLIDVYKEVKAYKAAKASATPSEFI